MSLADYAMLQSAIRNRQDANNKFRDITRWYETMMDRAQEDINLLNRQVSAIEQRLNASVFAYTSKLQAAMNAALTANNGQKDDVTYQSLFLQYNQAQEKAKMYLAMFKEQAKEVLKIKEKAYGEMEAKKQSETASCKEKISRYDAMVKYFEQQVTKGNEMWKA